MMHAKAHNWTYCSQRVFAAAALLLLISLLGVTGTCTADAAELPEELQALPPSPIAADRLPAPRALRPAGATDSVISRLGFPGSDGARAGSTGGALFTADLVANRKAAPRSQPRAQFEHCFQPRGRDAHLPRGPPRIF